VIARPNFEHRTENAGAAGTREMLRGLIEREHALMRCRHQLRKYLRAKLREGLRRPSEVRGKDHLGLYIATIRQGSKAQADVTIEQVAHILAGLWIASREVSCHLPKKHPSGVLADDEQHPRQALNELA